MKPLAFIDRTRAGAICVLICAAYGIAGLYPFNFIASNDVSWLSPGPGISLSGNSLIRSEAAFDLTSRTGITIELYLEPADEPSRDFSTLMSLYDGRIPENLLIAQWRSTFLVRGAWQDGRGRRRYREIAMAALPKGSRRLVTVTSAPAAARLYVDGAPARVYPKTFLAQESLRGDLIVGTGTRGGAAWRGKLFGVALFERALTPSQVMEHRALWEQNRASELVSNRYLAGLYLFDEGRGRTVRDASSRGLSLVIPEVYRAPAKQVLERPRDNWHEAFSPTQDVVINVVGFIPFGFFYYLYRSLARPGRRLAPVLQSVAVSGAISLLIELLQAFLPSRSSSLADVICNTGGGLAGALLATCRLFW